MSYSPSNRATITVDVDGADTSQRQIETVGDAMRRLNGSSLQGLGGQVDGIQSRLGGLKTALAGVAAFTATAFAVGAFTNLIREAIDATDAASDLSQKTGIAVEDLAGLELAFQKGGMESSAMAGSMARLSKGIVDGNETFERLKISSKNLDGSFKGNKQMLYELADSFAGMEDGAAKSALATQLFGKSGVDMIPMLNEGSAGLREMDEMAQKLGLSLSKTAVDEAGKFNDTMDLIKLSGQGMARGIAAELLPTLSNLAGQFFTTMMSGDKLKNTAAFLANGLKILYTVGVGIAATFSVVGSTLGAAAAQAVALLQGNFRQASEIGRLWKEDVTKTWTSSADTIAAAWSNTGDASVEAMAALIAKNKKAGASAAELAAQTKAANKAHEDEAKILAELNGLTGTFSSEWDQLSKLYSKGAITTEQLTKAQSDLLAKQPAIKAAADKEVKSLQEREAFTKQYTAALTMVPDVLAESVDAAIKEAEQQETLASTYGLTTAQLAALELARLEEQLAQRASSGLTLDEIDTLEKLIAAKKRTAVAMRNMEEVAAQKQVWQSIESTAHETFVSIFDSGKSAFDRLKDTLKNGLLDLLYQMTVKKWIVNISGQVSGQGGLEQVVGALGGSGSGNGWLGNISSLMSMGKTIFSGFSTGLATSMGGYITQFGNLIGSQGVSAFGTGMGLTSSQAGTAAAAYNAAGNTTVAGGLSAGSTAASVVSVAGWIAAGMAAADMLYSKGFDPNNGSTNTALTNPLIPGAMHNNKIFQALGMDKRWANMFSGASVVTALFGRKNPEVREQGLEGTINASGFNGQQYAYVVEKGGVFRSDKWYTKNAALDAEQDSGLDATVQGMILAVKSFGAVMGLETSAINGYNKAIKVQLTDDEAKNQEAIAKMFSEIGDELSLRLVPSIGTLSKAGETASATLQRVASDYAGIDAVLTSIGKQFGLVGLQSVEARERLVDLFGGLTALTQKTSAYAQNFLTDAERLKPVADALAVEMAGLGLSAVTTRVQFKQVVDGLDLSSAAGAKQYAAMMGLAEAFAMVHPATEGAVNDLASYRSALTEAYNAEAEALQATTSRLGTFAASLRSLKDSALLGSLSPLSPAQKYAEAARQFEATLASARADDPKAQANFAEVRTAFLEASRAVNASSMQYQYDFSYAQAVTEEAARWADVTAAGSEAQLAVLKAQVSGLIDVKKEIQTVGEILRQISIATKPAMPPLIGVAPPLGPVSYSPIGAGVNNAEVQRLQATNDALLAELRGLRTDNRQLGGDQIIATYKAGDQSADKIAKATTSAMRSTSSEVRVMPD